jgi:ubiquinone/menaquinone biosynthesis C-methylase UbiE
MKTNMAIMDIMGDITSSLGYPIRDVYQLLEPVLGTKAREMEWARRKGMAEEYWACRELPIKHYLADKIFNLGFEPRTILEVGCASGPNLYLLARKYPEAEIVGIDINKEAVEKGNVWFREEGISNVKLLARKAEELADFPDRHFDIVFSFATLLLIGPDKIERVVRQMTRVARHKVILIEVYGENPNDPHGNLFGFRSDIYWKRDYRTLVAYVAPKQTGKVEMLPFPTDLWAPGCGGGSIIYISIE